MTHGIYIGPLAHLKGKGALLRPLGEKQVMAQFDDTKAVRDPAMLEAHPEQILGLSLGFGWHEFDEADFRLTRATCFAARRDDSVVCRWCGLTWDVNDPRPPACRYPPHGVRSLKASTESTS